MDNNDHVTYVKDFSINLFNHVPTQNFDIIFIDGDHSYDGVKNDFEYFKNFANKFIVLHDIVNSACPGVVKFWNEIKHNYTHYEFIDQYNMEKEYLGIGLIQL
jgi:hypothetical protein